MHAKMIFIIVIIAIVIALIAGFLWYRSGIHQAEDDFLYANKSSGTLKSSFNCSTIPEITFEYPLFKGLDKPYLIYSDNECLITLNRIPNDRPNGAVITVTKLPTEATPSPTSQLIPKNNYGVQYQELSGVDGYLFYTSLQGYYYRVAFSNYSNVSIDHDLFWNTILDSFREVKS